MRVFMDGKGKYYKADAPRAVDVDAEVNFPSPDMLVVLTEEPIGQLEMLAKINDLQHQREEARLLRSI